MLACHCIFLLMYSSIARSRAAASPGGGALLQRRAIARGPRDGLWSRGDALSHKPGLTLGFFDKGQHVFQRYIAFDGMSRCENVAAG
jgi:hypothetical protein